MSKSLPLKKHNRLLFFVRLTSCPSDSCSFFYALPSLCVVTTTW